MLLLSKLCLATVAVLSQPSGATAGAQDSLPPELQAARSALDAGDIEQAIELAEHYQRRNRRDPRGYLMVGDAYAQRMPAGRFRAIRAYREAERLDRTNPEPPYRIGMIGFAIGGADGERLAADGLSRALGKDPLYRDAWTIWLRLFRSPSSRHEMIERLWPHRERSEVRIRIARLLMEDERYAEADSLLALSLATDSTNVAWLTLAAQSALEAADTIRGLRFYRRALANADHDSTEALWKQVVGIASPEEIVEWAESVVPAERAAWLRRFWAVRNPDLFRGINVRIAEHFARWRVARREYPLLHPLIGFQRDARARALNLEPSPGERSFHLRCEIGDQPTRAVTGGGYAHLRQPAVPIQYRPMGESAWWLSDEERSAEETKARLGGAALPEALARTFEPPVFLLLGLDLRGADSIGARVGYNLATGLSDRGLTYLRFGPPDGRALGGKNSINPECNTTELEYWDYDRYGTLRFSKPVAFSEGLRTLPEMVFRPMEYEQFELTKQVLVEDHTAVPAPLEFGVWTAELRSPEHPQLSDLVVVSTRGMLAASLVSPTGGERERRQSGAGVVSLQGEAGGFTLLAHARLGDELGRQRHRIVLRGFDSLPTMSDLLIGEVWASPLLDRRSMLGHLRRDLVFASGDTVRTYVELYGLAADARSVSYRVTYSLLRSGNIMEDYAKDDWPDAQRFEFERHEPVQARGAAIETLDILPQWIPEGRYLLRIDVEDLVARVSAGRSTIAFEVRN